MFEDYVKITYRSDPIGEEKIILYLTTFDIDAFERDQNLKTIPIKQECAAITPLVSLRDIHTPENAIDVLQVIESQMENYITCHYKRELEKMKNIIESNRMADKIKAVEPIIKQAEDIVNCRDVHCNVVLGDVINCKRVYCDEINGDVINSEVYEEV